MLTIISALLGMHLCTSFALQPPIQHPKSYNYFGYGSNMVTTTMTDMRRIAPLGVTAAVLPNYRLRFNIPGLPGIEPSAASVEESSQGVVHGVCYSLTPDDFAQVGRTEGVPFGYRWQPVRVATYVGNNEDAGRQALEHKKTFILAYTLVATFSRPNDIPPSKSYLGLIQQGARDWNMDREYRESLERIEYDKNLILYDGVAGATLKWAVIQKKLFG
jgi:hypothetical protein